MSYQFLPPLSDAEYEALRADIAANGMRYPIVVDEKGKILDGHHRARIAAELGFKPEREVLGGLTETEKRDIAFTLNTARRHMDAVARRAVVVASLKADPQLSDRQHGRRTGVSHPTVAGIRAELVAKGDVEKLSTRTDSTGRQQPASRSKPEEVDSATEGSTGSTSSPDQPALPVEADAQLDRVGAANADAREAPTGAAAWTAPVGAGGTAAEVDLPSADADGEGPSQSGPAQSSAAGAPTDLHTAGAPVNPSDLVIAIHGVLRFDVDEFAQNADADQIEELGAAFELLDEFRSKALAALIRANGFAENKAD